jgi:hypothetical protein
MKYHHNSSSTTDYMAGTKSAARKNEEAQATYY